jgi:hypothetical protein
MAKSKKLPEQDSPVLSMQQEQVTPRALFEVRLTTEKLQ